MLKVKGIKGAAVAAAMALAFSAPVFAAGEHSHDGHGAGEAKLTLNHGKKWQTDAALRKGMENIRNALAADAKLIHSGKLKSEQYEALAKKVNGEVAYIVQNCKLDKAADEQLHIVIADLMAGAEAMEGKEKGVAPRAGAERVHKALNAYSKHFDHPGWKKL
jgi:hypothetical protein